MRYLSKLTSFFIIAFISCATYAAGINWTEYSDGALEQAKTSGSPIIIYSKAKSCKWCLQMDKTTFKNTQVTSLINKNFKAIRLDIGNNLEAATKLNVMELPTIILFDKNGSQVKSIGGYIDADTLLDNLNALVGQEQS